MRVLYLSQHFTPEAGASQARAHDTACALVAAGHEVTLVCEMPCHPAGRTWKGYGRRLWHREALDGIDVVRVRVWASPSKTLSRRLLFYLSYMMMAMAAGLILVRGRFDLVFATSPPLFVGFAGLVLARLRSCHFVFEVRDPWPEAAIALGELKNPLAIRAARWLERVCVNGAAKIVAVSRGWCAHLQQLGVPEDKIVLVRNGANLKLFRPRPAEGAAMRRELGLSEDALVLLFAGLHGVALDIGTILRGAEIAGHPDRLSFLFVGDGPSKAHMVQRAKGQALGNVRFLDEVSRRDAATFFSLADAMVVAMRPAEFLRGTIPARFFDAWACACPVIFLGEGEAAEMVDRAGGGWTLAPESADALAALALGLAEDPSRCRRAGELGRRYVERHGDRAALCRQVVQVLEDVVEGRRTNPNTQETNAARLAKSGLKRPTRTMFSRGETAQNASARSTDGHP